MRTPQRDSVFDHGHRFWIKRSWTRLWWVAINPDEVLAEFDFPSAYRAWTRERLLAKLERVTALKESKWEEVRV